MANVVAALHAKRKLLPRGECYSNEANLSELISIVVSAVTTHMNSKKGASEPKFIYCKEDVSLSKVRPDYTIKTFGRQETSPKPVFVLEAKKIDESRALKEHLPQLFDYLRRLCLNHRYTHLCGVLTNYKSWIFVRYDLTAEVEAVRSRRVSHDDPVAARFEVCAETTILNKMNNLLSEAELARVILQIELCCEVLSPS